MKKLPIEFAERMKIILDDEFSEYEKALEILVIVRDLVPS